MKYLLRFAPLRAVVAIATAVSTVLIGAALPAQATELVYTPVNPLFGGNPNNATMLINSGNSQNPFKAPPAAAKTGLENFNDSIERAILSKLAGEVTSRMFPTSGVLATGGEFDAGSFKVTVSAPDPLSNVVTIRTTDKLTGASTVLEINKAMLSGL
jgi:curli production assembly/transport component CsgF